MTETTSAPEQGPTAVTDLPTREPMPDSTPAGSEASKPPHASPADAATAATTATTATGSSSSLAALLRSLPADADAFLAHLQRCLATPSGVDTLLLFICYTSRLAGAALSRLSQSAPLRRPPTPRELVALILALPDSSAAAVVVGAAGAKAAPALAPAARLAAVLGARLKNLGALASEARTIARLWTLVGMYFWARRLVLELVEARRRSSSSSDNKPEKSAGEGTTTTTTTTTSSLATLVSWVQLLTCGAFQVLENGAYLSGRGVLGWTPAQQGRAYVVGARFLGVYTALELGRLLAGLAARRGRDRAAVSPEEQAEADAMRRSLAINMAWAPLTLHWGTENGFLTDLVVGAGGCIPGFIQMRKLWRETA